MKVSDTFSLVGTLITFKRPACTAFVATRNARQHVEFSPVLAALLSQSM